MSNINNQTQDLFALDTVQDLDNETAAAVHGGAARIFLYTGRNFGGSRYTLTSYRAGNGTKLSDRPFFNNKISSVRILSGTWELRDKLNKSRPSLILRPGFWRLPSNLNNRVSVVVCKAL